MLKYVIWQGEKKSVFEFLAIFYSLVVASSDKMLSHTNANALFSTTANLLLFWY